ncbi:MAG: MATE family efflux transporter [Myxococcales bacterium]|nr:MATE family efflux transporter [Myxococcales bacterium]
MSTKSIRRQIVALAVPASVESVLQIGFGFADQIVIGLLGETSLAAVGLIGHMSFLSGIVLGALAAVAAILVAQYYGSQDRDGVSRSVGAVMQMAMIVTVPLALIVLLFAGRILELMGVEPAVVEAGAPFLRVISLTIPIALAGSIAASALRSLGDARTPMLVTFACVVLNTGLNFLLVFGWGPVPELGAIGAAWATLATQLLRLALMAWAMLRLQTHVSFKAAHFLRPSRPLLAKSFSLTWPIALTETFWSLGSFLYTLMVVELGTSMIAANQVVVTTEAIFIMASSGLSVAALTVIGQALGAKDEEKIRVAAKSVLQIGIASSLLFGLATAAASLLLGIFFKELDAGVLRIAMYGLLLNAAFQWCKVLNMVMGNGVLRAGGDTRFVLFADIISIYAIGIPLAFLTMRYTSWGLMGVLGAKLFEEGSRVFIFLLRYRSGKWRNTVAGPVAAH